jgi:hypothetical protein
LNKQTLLECKGNLARMQARQAEFGYYAKAGESLLNMSKQEQKQYNAKDTNI